MSAEYGTPRREVSQNANTLRLGATNPRLHRNAIDPSFGARTMRKSQGTGETVIRKDTKLFARGARWWSAPLRSRAATMALLRKTALLRPLRNDPWVRQAPNGIRA